jgi:F420-non-reducing hydrogenase large subunit
MKEYIVDPVTRIEGHSKIRITVEDKAVKDLQLNIFESPRMFEKFMEGKPAEEAPRIVERICGVCPISHHLASVKAVESAWDVEPPEAAVKVRKLLHMGQYIYSHMLHLGFFAIPDLMDLEEANIVALYRKHPRLVDKIIRIREVSSQIIEATGGKWGITAIPGGISRPIKDDSRRRLLDLIIEIEPVVDEVVETLFTIVESKQDLINQYPNFGTYYMALTRGGVHETYDGDVRVVNSNNEVESEFPPKDYLNYIKEETSSHSNVKYPLLMNNKLYRVGTLARLNVSETLTTPKALEYLHRYRKIFGKPAHNVLAYNLARAVETMHAIENATDILSDEDITNGKMRREVAPKAGAGVGVVEAMRGTLIHHYETDELGRLGRVNLIVATGHNIPSLENGLINLANKLIPKESELGIKKILGMLETLVRAYDPCLSCATHIVEIVKE